MWRRISTFIHWSNQAGGILAALFIALMAVLIFIEVIMRYVFNSPTTWTEEIVGYCLQIAAFIGAAYVLEKRRHIRVSILLDKVSEKMRTLLLMLSDVLGFFFCSVIFWKSGVWVLESYRVHEASYGILHFPLYTVRVVLPLIMFFLSINFINDFVTDLRRFVYPSREKEA